MQTVFVLFWICCAAAFRLVPHAPNFTPIISIALFSGAYLKKRVAYPVMFCVLFLSDAILGFYGPLMFFVYGSYALILFFGRLMRKNISIGTVIGSSLLGALFFFIISNFGVWALSSVYPKTLVGLSECYVMAIPFFRNMVVSTLLYSGLLFGFMFMRERAVGKSLVPRI